MFGLGWPEVLALVVIALLVFGPEKLPQAAQQAGRTLRQLRNMANNARADLQVHLGPEFRNFDPADLNPKHFVRKHLIDDIERDWDRPSGSALPSSPGSPGSSGSSSYEPYDSYDDDLADDFAAPGRPQRVLAYGEIPPYDPEAT